MGIKPRLRLSRSVPFLLAALVLVGCGHLDVSTDFYRGGRWETVTTYTVDRELLMMLGAEDLADQLDQFVREAADHGARAKWRQESDGSNVVYTIETKGKGLDTLSLLAFDGKAVIEVQESDGRRQIHFRQNMAFGDFETHSLTLRGGEIIDGNGEWVDDQTMTWVNHYGEAYAVLTERGSGASVGRVLGIAALVVAGAGLLLGGVYWWRRRKPFGPSPCPECGFWIPEGARFCPGCGRPR